jgi:hypothetical protein
LMLPPPVLLLSNKESKNKSNTEVFAAVMSAERKASLRSGGTVHTSWGPTPTATVAAAMMDRTYHGSPLPRPRSLRKAVAAPATHSVPLAIACPHHISSFFLSGERRIHLEEQVVA